MYAGSLPLVPCLHKTGKKITGSGRREGASSGNTWREPAGAEDISVSTPREQRTARAGYTASETFRRIVRRKLETNGGLIVLHRPAI